MTFREKLIELREAAGMTQPGLAEASGVPLWTLRNYEQGRTGERINFAYVVALASALGTTCTAFSECEDVATSPPEAERNKAKPKKPRGRPKKSS